MAATRAELAKMDKATAEVRRLYSLAKAKATDIRARADGFTGFLVTAAELSAAKAIEDLGPQVDTWATTRRRDAEDGRRADGSAFTVARFLDLGKDLASAANLYVQTSWEASLFAVVEQTVAATQEEVADKLNPLNWPTWAKVTAALVGVAAVAVLVGKGRAVVALLKAGGPA